MNDAQRLANVATTRFRFPFTASDQFRQGTRVVALRPVELPPPNGFSVELRSAWRSFEALLVPDSYSANLLASMAVADMQMRKTFSSLAKLMTGKGIKIGLRINDVPVDATADLPAAPWRRLELSASRLSAAVAEGQEFVATELTELTLTFLNLVLALLPIEDDAGEDAAVFAEGLPEGAKMRVEVNRYERNPANRAACIAAHGLRCKACDFDFERFYGPIGEGYIEVHHTTPVSVMGDSYIVDPTKELVPLCANCHAIVHRQIPPLSVEELAVTIDELRKK